jgi:3-dehydro-scyllo-inosose hydrolase
MESPKFFTTSQPDLAFEDSAVGRMKKEVWEASDELIDQWLEQFGIPSPPELVTAGSYIQTTVRRDQEAKREKNDVVLIPVGCSELHGPHTVSAMDTLFVTSICEGVRRYTAKMGYEVNLAMPPLLYGCHPYHHMGMAGTIVVREEVAIGLLHDVMLGLWNDGYRKQVIINNHGQFWMIESAVQRFVKKYQLPGIFRCLDWHRAVREFFRTKDMGGVFDTTFTHADETETSCGLLLFPKEMVNMAYAVDTDPVSYLPSGHMDTPTDAYRRPSRWSEGEGHAAIELTSTPSGVVGHATKASAYKAKRPVVAICRYLSLLVKEYLDAFPPGTVPPVEMTTLRTNEEMAPYLKKPMSEGWKPVYGLFRNSGEFG